MEYRVELTKRAVRDLAALYERIQADESQPAALWFNGLEATVYSLETYPNRGSVTPENKKLKHLLYGNKPDIYRIIYRIHEHTRRVTVLHIRHGARDRN